MFLKENFLVNLSRVDFLLTCQQLKAVTLSMALQGTHKIDQ